VTPKLRLLSLLLSFVALTSLGVAQVHRNLNDRAKTIKASAVGYSVAFTQVKFSRYFKDDLNSWWGAFNDPNYGDLVVTGLVIKHKGQKIRVPRSAYADLANINRLLIVKRGKGCEIRFDGGDASVGYNGKILVVGDRVTKRSVQAGEFPESQSEVTTYVEREIETN
jgi:hypothetical protein